MAISPNSDLISLSEATRFLARRPWQVLLLGILGMGLSALAAWIQVRAGLPEDKGTSSALIGAALVPLAVHGTRQALPKHSWRVGKSRALVTVGQPISTQGMTQDDVERLSAMARAQIERMRAELARVIAGS